MSLSQDQHVVSDPNIFAQRKRSADFKRAAHVEPATVSDCQPRPEISWSENTRHSGNDHAFAEPQPGDSEQAGTDSSSRVIWEQPAENPC
jgi:hypothetical protein